jgi:hypothetical protein
MQRNISLDVLKLTMALMIVGLHTRFMFDVNPLIGYLLVNGLFRIAVPVFLLINGYYFFITIQKGMFLIWLKRLLILYIIWMIFYSLYWLPIGSLNLHSISKLVFTILFGYFHLWYVAGLVGAGAVLYYLKTLPSKKLILIALSTFLVSVLFQYSGNYHLINNSFIDKLLNIENSNRNFLLFSFPFFCIGYLINKHQLFLNYSTKYLSVCLIAGLILLLLESSVNFINLGKYSNFNNLICLIIVCPIMFMLFIKKAIYGESKNIALYASSIYFIHVFIIHTLNKYCQLSVTYNTLITITLSFVISFFIIKLNKKIKYIL